MGGSMGVLPPPVGYLQRLRTLCDKHGILLIFDEVISGFGRLGFAFAAERYGVVPDMITFAKGITSGTVPMGGVIVRRVIHDAFMKGADNAVELFHGYTYSAHPLACAAALATLDLYRDEGLFERTLAREAAWAEAIHALRDSQNVVDIRTFGLTAEVELASRPGAPGARGYAAVEHAFFEQDTVLRQAGDTIVLTPPLIAGDDDVAHLAGVVRKAANAVDCRRTSIWFYTSESFSIFTKSPLLRSGVIAMKTVH